MHLFKNSRRTIQITNLPRLSCLHWLLNFLLEEAVNLGIYTALDRNVEEQPESLYTAIIPPEQIYTALERNARSANAEDEPESVYTSIFHPDQTHDNIYANVETI